MSPSYPPFTATPHGHLIRPDRTATSYGHIAWPPHIRPHRMVTSCGHTARPPHAATSHGHLMRPRHMTAPPDRLKCPPPFARPLRACSEPLGGGLQPPGNATCKTRWQPAVDPLAARWQPAANPLSTRWQRQTRCKPSANPMATRSKPAVDPLATRREGSPALERGHAAPRIASHPEPGGGACRARSQRPHAGRTCLQVINVDRVQVRLAVRLPVHGHMPPLRPAPNAALSAAARLSGPTALS